MAENFSYDVFLSHNAKDKPRVRQLAEKLKQAGLRVWFDEWNIRLGEIISLKVEEGLEQSRVLVLCISPNALASDWVALERSTAVHRDPSNEGRRFIPLLLADCELPATLRRYKYVDYRDDGEAEFKELLIACRSEDSERQSVTTPAARKSLGRKNPARKKVMSVSLFDDRIGTGLQLHLCQVLSGHSKPITRVNWAPNGFSFASAGQDGVIRIWDTDTGELKQELSVHARQVQKPKGRLSLTDEWALRIAWTPAWSPDGLSIACGYGDGTIRVWDVATAKILKTLHGHEHKVNNVAWSFDGKRLASSGDDSVVKLWDMGKETCLATLAGHESGINNIAWQPNGHLIASGSLDTTIRLWDTRSYECVSELLGHTDIVITVTWSPEGKVLASSSGDGTIRLWDPDSGLQRRVVRAHSGAVSCIAFSPDGRLLASKGIEPDSTVRIRQTIDWQVVATLLEPAGWMWFAGIAFHPTRPLLATLDRGDTAIRIWEFASPANWDEIF